MVKDQFIIISENTLRDLIRKAAEYDILEENGVDNWQGYGEGFDELNDRQQEYLNGFGLKI